MYGVATQVDLQWCAGLSKPLELLLNLVESTVFGCEMDNALRMALRSRRDPATLLATQPLSALVQDIEAALEDEKTQTPPWWLSPWRLTTGTALVAEPPPMSSHGACRWSSPPTAPRKHQKIKHRWRPS